MSRTNDIRQIEGVRKKSKHKVKCSKNRWIEIQTTEKDDIG